MAIYGDRKHNENMEHISKQEFDFYVDRKVTMWIRELHTIKAINKDEAIKQMIHTFNDGMDSFIEQELLIDTIESLDVGENDGESTLELYDEDNQLLTSNIRFTNSK